MDHLKASIEAQAAAYRERIKPYEAAVPEYEALAREAANLRQVCADQEAQLSTLRISLSQAALKRCDHATHKREFEELQRKYYETKDEAATLRQAEAGNLRERLAAARELQQLKDSAGARNDEIKALKVQLSNARAEIKQLSDARSEAHGLRAERDDLVVKLRHAQQEQGLTMEQVHHLTKKLTEALELENERNAALKDVEALRSQLAAASVAAQSAQVTSVQALEASQANVGQPAERAVAPAHDYHQLQQPPPQQGLIKGTLSKMFSSFIGSPQQLRDDEVTVSASTAGGGAHRRRLSGCADGESWTPVAQAYQCVLPTPSDTPVRLSLGLPAHSLRFDSSTSGTIAVGCGHTADATAVGSVELLSISHDRSLVLKGRLTPPTPGAVTSVDVSMATIVGGSSTGTIYAWRSPDDESVTMLRGHAPGKPVVALAYVREHPLSSGGGGGGLVVSGSRDRTVRLWDLSQAKAVSVLQVGSRVQSLALASDGYQLAVGTVAKGVRVFDLRRSGALCYTITPPSGAPPAGATTTAVLGSQMGASAASTSAASITAVDQLSLQPDDEAGTARASLPAIRVAFSPSTQPHASLLAAFADGTVGIYSPLSAPASYSAATEPQVTLQLPQQSSSASPAEATATPSTFSHCGLCWSPDGHYALWTTPSGDVRAFDAVRQSAKKLSVWRRHGGALHKGIPTATSPQLSSITTARAVVGPISQHASSSPQTSLRSDIIALDWSADGRWLASCDAAGTVAVWGAGRPFLAQG